MHAVDVLSSTGSTAGSKRVMATKEMKITEQLVEIDEKQMFLSYIVRLVLAGGVTLRTTLNALHISRIDRNEIGSQHCIYFLILSHCIDCLRCLV